MRSVEILIPTWNGRKLLAECLPKVVECSRELAPAARITIVDDASTDGTIDYLRRDFPQVHVTPLGRRSGFPKAVNAGAFASTADIILLLNNDMVPHGPVLRPLLEHFRDPEVAAVSARVLKWDATTLDVGRHMRTFEQGQIAGVGGNEDFPAVSFTFFASGAAMAVSRHRFIELGGFDEIYSPGYVEDTDFSYRAWKRGLKIVWDPRSTFLHMGSATFAPRAALIRRCFNLCRVRYLSRRNSFFFYLKNMTDPRARREYRRHLPGRALRALLAGDAFYFAAFLRTLPLLGELARRRREEAARSVISDFEVFTKLDRLCEQAHSLEEPAESRYAATVRT